MKYIKPSDSTTAEYFDILGCNGTNGICMQTKISPKHRCDEGKLYLQIDYILSQLQG